MVNELARGIDELIEAWLRGEAPIEDQQQYRNRDSRASLAVSE
jgi:hypothetical protein